MKKIDLHIHNKAIKNKDDIKRNIDPKNFKNIMKEAQIGVAAITNHNYFSDDIYINFKDKNYLLLPGMEIDFIHDKKRMQLNLILDEKDKNILFELTKYFNNKKEIELLKLIEIIKEKEVILFLDKKNSDKKVNWDVEKLLKEKLPNAVIIFDAYSKKVHRLLESNNYNSLIGSDVTNWDKYLEKDKPRLLTTWMEFKNFKKFYLLLSKNGETIKEITKKINYSNYKINIDNDEFVIKISSSLNVIIGDKATGKTKIIENINRKLINDGSLVEMFLIEKNEKKYEEILKIKDTNINTKKEIEKLKEEIENILNIKKINCPSPISIKESIEHKRNSNIRINDMKDKNITKLDFKIYTKSIELVNNLSSNLEKINFDKKIIMNIKNIKHQIIDLFIKNNDKKIIGKIFNKQNKKIKEIVIKNTGEISKNIELNTFKIFNYRKTINDYLKKIEKISGFKNKKIIWEFNLPNIGKIKNVQKDKIIDFKNNINKDNRANHQVGDWNKNVVNFFKRKNNMDFSLFVQFVEYFKKNKDNDYVISNKKLFKENGEIFNPSTGERNLLILLNSLKKDVDFLLLDEPSVHLGTNLIMEVFNKELSKLKIANKTIIIATHNPNLGINSIPRNYIYRKKENNIFKTYQANFLSDYFICNQNKNDKIKFNEIILEIFEGNKKAYNFRKEFYEN